MPRPTHVHRGLAQASRLRIARLVMEHPGLGLGELSERTGLHENTLRDHVRVLVDEGIIRAETEHRPHRGRPRWVYFSAVEPGVDNDEAQQRIDRAIEHGDLLRRIAPETAGSLDDAAAHQLDALYEHLDEVGLDPEIDEQRMRVELHPCPFHPLVDDEPDTVCVVHERLIRDVLHRAGGPLEVDRLLPMVGPRTCLLHLRAHGE